jgi:hypothetical protein
MNGYGARRLRIARTSFGSGMLSQRHIAKRCTILFKLSVSSTTSPRTDKDVRQHLSESQRYLLLLYAYQPDATKKSALMAEVAALDSATANLSTVATSAAGTVRGQFQADPRLNAKK